MKPQMRSAPSPSRQSTPSQRHVEFLGGATHGPTRWIQKTSLGPGPPRLNLQQDRLREMPDVRITVRSPITSRGKTPRSPMPLIGPCAHCPPVPALTCIVPRAQGRPAASGTRMQTKPCRMPQHVIGPDFEGNTRRTFRWDPLRSGLSILTRHQQSRLGTHRRRVRTPLIHPFIRSIAGQLKLFKSLTRHMGRT